MSSVSTVLIYEYFSGGGCPPGPLPGGLASEALGMLWALLTDFRRLGVVRTITALDCRIERIISGVDRTTLPADKVFSAAPGDHKKVYLSLLERCEAALIIAPETNGILSELTAYAESAGVTILSSSSSAITLAGNKASCCRILGNAKLPIPETQTASFISAPEVAGEIGCPLVIKPIDGVGSEGVFLVDNFSDLQSILTMVRQTTSHNEILMQSFSPGIPVSVSLLVAKGKCFPLSLNLQLFDAGSPFQYRGSAVPLHHRAGDYALKLACAAVGLIPGLNGYVGVDLILEDAHGQVIEINPRLTTSYIGIRQVARANLAQAILDAGGRGILPEPIPLIGQVVIKKDDPETWDLSLAKYTSRIKINAKTQRIDLKRTTLIAER